jgi:hypothetical protein
MLRIGSWLVDSDCGGLIPPCWQELHYLYAGIMIGVILAVPLYSYLEHQYCT